MNESDNHPKTSTDSFSAYLRGTIADRIILVCLLIAIVLLWLEINRQLAAGPATAYVYHQQTLLAKYPLPDDDRLILVHAEGEIGESQIEITKDGIRFISSPCSTHHCTLSGQKSHPGSVIACVPNHVMAVIKGRRGNSPDAIQFDAVTE